MNFIRVTARNWCGQDFNIKLAPITLILGPNSTGKSSKLNALMLASQGYLPGEPKAMRDARDIFDKFASGSPCAVGCETSAGARTMRVYERIPKGADYTVKASGDANSLLPDMALDAMIFNGPNVSGPARLKFMFRQSKSAKTAKTICDEICYELARSVSDFPEVRECFLAQSAEAIDYLEMVSSRLENKRKEADQSVKRFQASAQASTQSSSKSSNPDPAAESKLVDLRNELETAIQKRERAEQALEDCRDKYRKAKLKSAKADNVVIGGEWPTEEPSDKALLDAESKSDEANSWHRENLEKIATRKQRLAAKCSECGAKKKISADDRKSINAEIKVLQKADKVLSEKAESCAKILAIEKAKYEEADYKWNLKSAYDALNSLPQLESDGKSLNQSFIEAGNIVTALRLKIQTADEACKALIQQRAEAAIRAKNAVECEKWVAIQSALKIAQKIVAEKQAEMIADCVGPILDRINAMCAGQLPCPVTWSGGEFVFGGGSNTRSPSTSEKTLVNAALCVALAQGSPIKIACIDRFEAMDCERQAWFMQTCLDLIHAKELDQVIVTGVSHGEATPMIECGETDVKVIFLNKVKHG